jgi:hypothetical protein
VVLNALDSLLSRDVLLASPPPGAPAGGPNGPLFAACRARLPRITRRLLTLIGLAFLTGCGPLWTVRHWDVTVEVDTPAGPRNGRGVVETRARERNAGAVHVGQRPADRAR